MVGYRLKAIGTLIKTLHFLRLGQKLYGYRRSYIGEGKRNVSNQIGLLNFFHSLAYIENDHIWDKWMKLFVAGSDGLKGL